VKPSARPPGGDHGTGTASRALRTALATWQERRRAFLAAADEPTGHGVRVASRRLLAALDLAVMVRPDLEIAPLRREVKQRFDLTSPLRELHVNRLLLRHLGERGTAAAALLRRLDEQAAIEAKTTVAALRRAGVKALLHGIAELIRSLERESPTHEAAMGQPELDRRLKRTLRHVGRRREAALRRDDEAHRHALRLAVKRARYLLELVGATRGLAVADPIARARGVQDALGALRDVEVLAVAVRTFLAEHPEQVRHAGPLLKALAALHDERAQEVGRRLPELDAVVAWTDRTEPPSKDFVLLLVRHAEAVSREGETTDADRPLTDRGARLARRVGRALARLGFGTARIFTSPLVRARATGQAMADAMDRPEVLATLPALAPGGSIAEVLRRLGPNPGVVILVGHAPELGRLASRLLVGSRRVHLHLRKGGVACLSGDVLGPGRAGELEWLLTARQLASLRCGAALRSDRTHVADQRG
jgi:phosphohistidine phosphatase